MDNNVLDILDNIHRSAFRKFKYETDQEQYNTIEKWVMPPDYYDGSQKFKGDCEDFALYCRKLCDDVGLKTRLVFCKTEDGEGHLVLEHRGYVLDNRQHSVVYRDEIDYTWISISGYNPGDPWHEVTK